MSQQDMDRRDGVFAAALGYQLASEDIDLLLWLHAEAVWQREQETARLRARIHEAVDETQRRYAKYQSRCDYFDTWSRWAREHAERMGDHFWTHTSQVHRLYVMSLQEEIARLRREVEFEARGANTFAGADAIADGDCVTFVAEDFGLDVDTDAGGVYVSLNHRRAARTEVWGDDVNVDYDADGIPTGVEILRCPGRAVHPEADR